MTGYVLIGRAWRYRVGGRQHIASQRVDSYAPSSLALCGVEMISVTRMQGNVTVATWREATCAGCQRLANRQGQDNVPDMYVAQGKRED